MSLLNGHLLSVKIFIPINNRKHNGSNDLITMVNTALPIVANSALGIKLIDCVSLLRSCQLSPDKRPLRFPDRLYLYHQETRMCC